MSAYLDNIISKQHGSTTASVVFLDVVKYSMRKSVMQQKVINNFNSCLTKSIENVSAKHVAASQRQSLNLSTDIIKLPTGDGAAIVFPFNGLQSIHLDFALSFLHESLNSRGDIICGIFEKNGWCNCHDFFDVRTGVSDGKTIIFKDINEGYNVAGSTINVASRIMGIADKQQVIFTKDAYNSLIDMTEDTTIEEKFSQHGKVSLKHDLEIEVCQYVGSGENYLNRDLPIQIQIAHKEASIQKAHPFFSKKGSNSFSERMRNLEVLEVLKDMPIPAGMAAMFGNDSPTNVDAARALVEVFKNFDKILKGGPLLDAPSSVQTPNSEIL